MVEFIVMGCDMFQVTGLLTQIRSRVQSSGAGTQEALRPIEIDQPSTALMDISTPPISGATSPPIQPDSRRFDADYDEFLSNKIDQLSSPWRPEPRAELFERAYAVLVKLLNAAEPPLSEVEFKLEEDAFRAAVERLEARRHGKLRAKPVLEKVTAIDEKPEGLVVVDW